MEVTRELYNSMAEGDADVSLDCVERALAKQEAAQKKSDFLDSIPLDKNETNTGDSQTKEKGTTT